MIKEQIKAFYDETEPALIGCEVREGEVCLTKKFEDFTAYYPIEDILDRVNLSVILERRYKEQNGKDK